MTPQRLGPIELDANGEASGEGWLIRQGEEGTILHPSGYYNFGYFAVLGLSLEETINRALMANEEVMRALCIGVEHDDWLPDLQAWCRAVGWPGFEAEESRDNSQPFWVQPGGLRYEPYTATLESGGARWIQRNIWMDEDRVWWSGPVNDKLLGRPVKDRVVSILLVSKPDWETP